MIHKLQQPHYCRTWLREPLLQINFSLVTECMHSNLTYHLMIFFSHCYNSFTDVLIYIYANK